MALPPLPSADADPPRPCAQQAEARLGKEVGEIFLAYRLILEDRSVRQLLFQAVEQEGLDAAGAVARQFARYHVELRALDSEYLSERAEDLAALEAELTSCLSGSTLSRCCRDTVCHAVGKCRLGNDHILVASELTASVAVQLDQHTRGFVVARGGVNMPARPWRTSIIWWCRISFSPRRPDSPM